MSKITDPEKLRRLALAFQRQANTLPRHDPEHYRLARAAAYADNTADEIEALSPEMREDLEIMMASVRVN